MHVRITRVRRNGSVFEYPQLVESYRDANGRPTHRVVASLRDLSGEQIDNLKIALASGRLGQRVAAVEGPPKAPPPPIANLDYLPLACLLALARRAGLPELLASLLPQRDASIAPADVVLALVLQRCVDPGSKLYAARWFPRTALPEMLGIEPDSFNNTRLHRVLDDLEAATPALMAQLPSLCLAQDRAPAFAAMFLDLTDAHFVGHGPSFAERGKTKDGFVARKIGIVLLCNERGFPLRWQVVEGCRGESLVMTDLFHQIARCPWAQGTPIVCDRAMGHSSVIETLASTGLHFLVALTSTEFDSYAPELPVAHFRDLLPTESSREDDVREAAARARAAGLEQVADTLWTKDFGVVEVRAEPGGDHEQADSSIADTLRLARDIQQAVDDRRFSHFAAAGRSLGVTASVGKKYRRLLALPEDVQTSILQHDADALSLGDLLRLLALPSAEAQREAFHARLRTSTTPRSRAPLGGAARAAPRPALRVRVVAAFNPERFVEQHLTEARKRKDLELVVDQLNARLAAPASRMSASAALAVVDRRLRSEQLLDAFDVRVESTPTSTRAVHRVVLTPVAAAWERRRRSYGFSIYVGHHELKQTAAELCVMYRSKDAVEKDFQTIKSVVELRPIRHRNDGKVRAHVTLCVLALLLERLLEAKLGEVASAPRAIEELATCHLNVYRGSAGRSAHVLTQPTREQRALLAKLGLRDLADSARVAALLHPRLCLQD